MTVYFTVQSNIAVAVYFGFAIVLSARRGDVFSPAPRLRGGITTWILTTGLVYHFINNAGANPLPGLFLDDARLAGDNFSSFLLHYIIPVMVLIDWVAVGKHGVVRLRDALLWAIYPIVYAAVMLVRGLIFTEADVRFPYPFIDPVNSGWDGVATGSLQVVLYIAVIGVLVVAMDKAVTALARRRHHA